MLARTCLAGRRHEPTVAPSHPACNPEGSRSSLRSPNASPSQTSSPSSAALPRGSGSPVLPASGSIVLGAVLSPGGALAARLGGDHFGRSTRTRGEQSDSREPASTKVVHGAWHGVVAALSRNARPRAASSGYGDGCVSSSLLASPCDVCSVRRVCRTTWRHALASCSMRWSGVIARRRHRSTRRDFVSRRFCSTGSSSPHAREVGDILRRARRYARWLPAMPKARVTPPRSECLDAAL